MRLTFGTRLAIFAVGACLLLPASGPRAADAATDCFSEDNERRLSGCSALIETPGLGQEDLSLAFAMRALAYSLKGNYERALADYDEAIRINPAFAVALNNRAWALFKAGRAREGMPDVERSLALQPMSSHSLDTRAHIRQQLGDLTGALADYEMAMVYGGERIIKLYQCGLQAKGHYDGKIDGRYTAQVKQGLEACVRDKDCDPLPADEECRATTS